MKDVALINPENATESEANSWPVREAARAIVVDNDNRVALLHVSNEHYYKLPGGGIEESEGQIIGLVRECIEEIGSDIEVVREIGRIVEWRKMFNLKQVSYCYFARAKGEKMTPQYTETELAGGFEAVWLPYTEALVRLSKNEATSEEGRLYIVPRDTAFLKAAAKFIRGGNGRFGILAT